MDYMFLVLGIVFIVAGFLGCLVPMLPGPPFSFVGILTLHFSSFGEFPKTLLIVLAAITVLVTIFDLVVPVWGTRKFGGSKYGIRGATVGLVVGLFFGPLGIVLGPFVGAFVGEIIFKDDVKYAIKAGFGSLLGFLTGIGLKLAASSVITFYFFKELIIK